MPDRRNAYLRRLDDETVDISVQEPDAVIDRLLEASLRAGLGRKDFQKLCSETCLAVTLEVPSASWVTPLVQVIGRICREAEVVSVMPPRKRGDPTPFSEAKAAKAFGNAKSVIAITTDRANLLPNSFMAAADLTARLAIPDLRSVQKVIEETCVGSARSLRKSDLVGLSLYHIVYSIRPGTARASIDRLRAAAVARSNATISWTDAPLVDDLVGYGEAKIWAQRAVGDFARLRAGENAKLVACLLAGAPGTGKTRLVQSIAKTAGLTLVETSVASWFSRSTGDLDGVVKSLVEVVDRALEVSPSLLFLDELDAIPSRATLSGRGSDWWTPVITGFLLEIDRLKASGRPVLLVAATNHADRIDSAMIRPGRIDKTVVMTVPEGEDLVGVFRQYCGSALTDPEIRSAVDIVGSATGAQVVAWIEEARRRAEDDGAADFELRHLLGAMIPSDPRPPELLRSVAVHEAAHAVVALALGVKVDRISILGSGRIGGVTSVLSGALARRTEFEEHLVIALAGRVGDEEFGEGADAGAEADLAMATRLAAIMRGTAGLVDTLVHNDPDALAMRLASDRTFADAVESDLVRAKARARKILLSHRNLHEAFVGALLQKRVLTEEDIEIIARDDEPSEAKSTKSPAKRRRAAV